MSLRIMYTLLLVVNYCVDVNYIELTMLSLVSHAFSSQSGDQVWVHTSSPVLYCWRKNWTIWSPPWISTSWICPQQHFLFANVLLNTNTNWWDGKIRNIYIVLKFCLLESCSVNEYKTYQEHTENIPQGVIQLLYHQPVSLICNLSTCDLYHGSGLHLLHLLLLLLLA
jgi:hypothetical protein